MPSANGNAARGCDFIAWAVAAMAVLGCEAKVYPEAESEALAAWKPRRSRTPIQAATMRANPIPSWTRAAR
jgi:hypothetical protein